MALRQLTLLVQLVYELVRRAAGAEVFLMMLFHETYC